MSPYEALRIILIVLLTGQFMISSAAAGGSFNLAGSEWGVAGETGRTAPFVQFRSDGIVAGSSGCNRFTGTYTLKGDAYMVSVTGVTDMYFQINEGTKIEEGRTLLRSDNAVAVIGYSVAVPDPDGKPLVEVGDRIKLTADVNAEE
jgi:hypothetical protein